jgi:hypothetical protein
MDFVLVGPAINDSIPQTPSEFSSPQDDFIPNAYDISALRLASHHLESTTLNTFTRRFFTTRKHMLSKVSVTCLYRIALSPKFNFLYGEVDIGLERINSGLTMCISDVSRQCVINWRREALDDWQALVDEQREFDASDRADAILKAVLKGFKNLMHVRIQFPKLNRLVVQDSNLPFRAFPHFLENHKDTLESIACDNTKLTVASFSAQADADLCAGYPTWCNVFEILLKMPRFSELGLSTLKQNYVGDQPPATDALYEDDIPTVPGTTSIVAHGGKIAVKLGHVIERPTFVEEKAVMPAQYAQFRFNGLDKFKVWFPATV